MARKVISGTSYHIQGHRIPTKAEAQRRAKELRAKGHKTRVFPARDGKGYYLWVN